MIRIKESDLLLCCGSTAWAREMAAHSFPNAKEVFATGDSIWWSLTPDDWREAFRAHPKIGDRATHQWSREEQASARHATDATLAELRELNQVYEERFGYIFIICANGRSVHSILEALKARLRNTPEVEIKIAAGQQLEITHLRLKRLIGTQQ
jgi:2-oxo-4-hydroxy-4-carboxy-5-ureidoimidazoline decarboxylase